MRHQRATASSICLHVLSARPPHLCVHATQIFGAIYLADAGVRFARAGHYGDHFFFSVQTLSTIGYGTSACVPVACGTDSAARDAAPLL